jgi:transcriptional regulator with GAF, ATPase, and Fis domain
MTRQTVGDQIELASSFAELGRKLTGHYDLDNTFSIITARAIDLVANAEHAAISRGRRGRFETVAATSDIPLLVDSVQYRLGSGPCVDAILEDHVYRAGDLGAPDQRWPEFGRQAAERFGVNSLLSVRLFLEDDDMLAGLNLYSSKYDAYDEDDELTATLLATHGALAVAAAQRQDKIDNLAHALQTSRRIGAAIGVLMAMHKTTYDQAFDLLKIASQHTHRKLVDIAEDVLETGQIALPRVSARPSRD